MACTHSGCRGGRKRRAPCPLMQIGSVRAVRLLVHLSGPCGIWGTSRPAGADVACLTSCSLSTSSTLLLPSVSVLALVCGAGAASSVVQRRRAHPSPRSVSFGVLAHGRRARARCKWEHAQSVSTQSGMSNGTPGQVDMEVYTTSAIMHDFSACPCACVYFHTL
jgi:hypothetical protein